MQSIHNILNLLGNEVEFFVLTSNAEFGSNTELDVEVNSWIDYQGLAMVRYQSAGSETIESYRKIIEELGPNLIYLNGIFSFNYFLKPLLAIRKGSRKVIIAPRGMLQKGALAIKPLKKKIYLNLFKALLPYKKYYWHATDLVENQDIVNFTHNADKVVYAPVLPELKDMVADDERFSDSNEELRICTISLITKKKGILNAIEIVKALEINKKVVYHIYGPVKDIEYWNGCLEQIPRPDQNLEIEYKGPLDPSQVHQTLQNYYVYILPTAGENFGHSIFEALAAGTVTAISSRTPFVGLQEKNAGIDDNKESALRNWLTDQGKVNTNSMWKDKSASARKFAEVFFQNQNYKPHYVNLFKS